MTLGLGLGAVRDDCQSQPGVAQWVSGIWGRHGFTIPEEGNLCSSGLDKGCKNLRCSVHLDSLKGGTARRLLKWILRPTFLCTF